MLHKNNTIVFVDDACQDFNARPVFNDFDKNCFLVVTEANELLHNKNHAKTSLVQLSPQIPFLPTETASMVKQISNHRFLLATNLFRFFTFELSLESETIQNARPLNFRYSKTLKPFTPSQIAKHHNFLFFFSGKFIFSFNENNDEFKILKLLNNDVIAFEVYNNSIFVLTRKEFFQFSCEINQATVTLTPVIRQPAPECTCFGLLDHFVVLLNLNQELIVFDLRDCKITKQLKTNCPFQNELKFEFIASINHQQLIAINRSHVFVFNNDFSRVEYIFDHKKYTHLSVENQLLSFNHQKNVKWNIGKLTTETYTKCSKRTQFEHKTLSIQISLLKNYLVKKAFKKGCFSNQIELLRDLLVPMNLKRNLLKDSKMKQMVLEFFEIINAFSVAKFAKFYLPRIYTEKSNQKRGSGFSLGKDFLEDTETADSISHSANSKQKEVESPKTVRVDSNTFRLPKKEVEKKLKFDDFCGPLIVRQNKKRILAKATRKLRTIWSNSSRVFEDQIWWTIYVVDRFAMLVFKTRFLEFLNFFLLENSLKTRVQVIFATKN